jgi:uncharacterized protein
MSAALLGLIGVLVGVILTHFFAISNEWRNRRMEAMVGSVIASIRVLNAHEGIHQLLQGGAAPALTDERAIRAITERNEAFYEWRTARARLEIVVPDDKRLEQAVDDFNYLYRRDDRWVSIYLREGKDFCFEYFRETEGKIWEEMRDGRHHIITCCRVRSQLDARWRERIRLALFKRPDDERSGRGRDRMEHLNEDVVREAFAAFAKDDIDELRKHCFAENIRWHVPGRSPLAGDYEGADQVVELFSRIRERSGDTFKAELHDVVANDKHTIALFTASAKRDGRQLEDSVAQINHICDGKITEVWSQFTDLYAVDEFWS